jgi:hypothetical protein
VRVSTIAAPSWSTIELCTIGVPRGRVPSALMGPTKVSENSQTRRPSGNRTEAVLSPPLQRPLVSP